MLQVAQVQLQSDLAQLEAQSAWMQAANGGVPLSQSQQAALDQVLLRIADDLVKIADLTQGSIQSNHWGDLYRTDEKLQRSHSPDAVQARMASTGYQADLNAWVAGQSGASAHDAQDRFDTLRREGGTWFDLVVQNGAALARASQANGADVQQLVATLMDDLLPEAALEDVRQGMAMLQAFNAADLAMVDALKHEHFGGRQPDAWEVANFEAHVSRALQNGGTLGFQSHDARGHFAGWSEVKLYANALRTSVLLGELSQARENLKKELQELVDLQGSLQDLEKTLGELVRLIAVESLLMSSQWDDQILGDLARSGVMHTA